MAAFNIQYFNGGRNMNPCDGPGNSFDGIINPYDGNENLFDGNGNAFDVIGYPFYGNVYQYDVNSKAYGINGNPFNGNGNQIDWNGNPSLTRPTRNHTPEAPWIYYSTCNGDHGNMYMGTYWISESPIVCETCGKRHKGRCWHEKETTAEYSQQFPLAETHYQASVVDRHLSLSRPSQNHTPEIQWIYCSKCKRDHRGTCWHKHEESNDNLSTRTNMTVIHYYDRQSSTYSDFYEDELRRTHSRSSDGTYRSRPRTGIIQSQIGPYHSYHEQRVKCKICGKEHKDRCWHEKELTTSRYRQRSPLAANKSEGKSQVSLVDEKKKTGQIDSSTKLINVKNHTETHITDIIIPDMKKKDCPALVVDEKNKSDQIDSSTKLKNVKKHTDTNLTGIISPDIRQKDCPASLINVKKEIPNSLGEIDNSTVMINSDTKKECPALIVDEKNKSDQIDSSTKLKNVKKHIDTNLPGIIAPDVRQKDCPASLINVKKEIPNSLGVIDNSTVIIDLDIEKKKCPDLLVNLKNEIPNVLQDIDNSTTPMNIKNCIGTNLTGIFGLDIKNEDCLDSLVDVKKKTCGVNNSTKFIKVKNNTELFSTNKIDASLINVKNDTKKIPNSLGEIDSSTTLMEVQKNTKTYSTDNFVYNSTQTRKINQNCLTDSQSMKRMIDNDGKFVPKICKVEHGPNESACDVYDQPTELPKTSDKTIKSVEDETTKKRAGLLIEAGEKVPNKLGHINNQILLANDTDKTRKKFDLSDIVIKFLNPYYQNNYIRNTQLFKFMAKNIVHTLLKSPIFPEEQYIQNMIENMFEMYGKETINCENDAQHALQNI